ncbi:MAG TPA: nuclear transport factor 2 family protein [Pyrinomonadaceae bacterium]|jgi:ketosteroid isomerase-like protein
MKLFSRPPVFVLFLLALSIAACGQNKPVEPETAVEFEKIYKEFDEAAKKRDIHVVEKYLADEYELQNGKTITRRAEVVRKVKENFAAIDEVIESSAEIEKIEIKDGNYLLRVSSTMIATYKLASGKTSKIETVAESTDVWTKTAGGWKEVRQLVHKLKILVDGKEVSS